MPIASSSDHLGPDDITAFVATGPAGAHGEHIMAHLARCGDCREEVLEVSRLARLAAPKVVKSGAMVAAAAAIALAAWLGLRPGEEGVDQQRSAAAPAAGAVLLVAPLGPVSRDAPLTFTWRAAHEAVEYRLTLLDAGGDVVWNRTTVDTVASLPLETSLAAGPAYYWFVDVLQADGSSATSGAREFRVTR
jgi:hypothetical protein